MRLTIDRGVLLGAVSKVAGAANAKSTLPILGCILLKYDGARLTLSATDTYIGIVHSVTSLGGTAGALAVPGKDFAERVKAMPAGAVDVDVSEGVLTLKAGKRKHTLKGLSAEDYPAMPTAPTGHPVPVSSLSQVFARTSFAMCLAEDRPALNGLRLEMGDVLTAVATDGHRLALAHAPLPAGIKGEALVSVRAVTELRKLLEGMTGDARIAVESGTMFLRLGDTIVWTKVIDLAFPPYGQVIPADRERTMTVPRAALLDAIRSTMVASDAKSNGVRLDVEPGSIRFSAESQESTSGDELDLDTAGTRGVIGFAGQYLADVLVTSTAETVEVSIAGELDPICVYPGPKGSAESTHAIMPMRI